MRTALSKAYSGLGWLVLALGVVQFFLAGLGAFGEGYSAHQSVGRVLQGVTLLVVVCAVAGPRNGRDIGMAVVLLVMAGVQGTLAQVGTDAPAVAAFHPVLGLLILGLAAHIGRRYIGSGARGSGVAAAA